MRIRRVLLVSALIIWGVVPAPVSGQDTSEGADVSSLCDPGTVNQFTDVAPGGYGADYILCMRALGLSVGLEDDVYNPESHLTRAQMASFLARLWQEALGRQCPENVEVPFVDIAGSPHEGSIGCLYGLGITVGTTPVTFGPAHTLTASQISRFLARLYDKAGNSCGPVAEELGRAVRCLTDLRVIPSVIEGVGAGAVTRDQMAVYVIGLWHNLAGRGLPPPPPHNPVADLTEAGGVVAVTRRSFGEDGEESDDDDGDGLAARTTTLTTLGQSTVTGTTVPDGTPYTDNDGIDTPFTDNDGTDSDGYDTPDGGSTIGTRTTTATTVSTPTTTRTTKPTSTTSGTTFPDNTPFTDNDGTDSDGYDTPDGGSTIGTRTTTATTVSTPTTTRTTKPTSTTSGATFPDYTPDSDDSDSSD